MEWYEAARYIFIGFFATIVGGFWGLGGGVFIVPALLISGIDISIAAPASLFQMLPSSFRTVRKQFPLIGWTKDSWGRRVAIPLCGATFVGGFLGKPIGYWLLVYSGSSMVREGFYLILIGFMLYKTLADKKNHGPRSDSTASGMKVYLTVIAGGGIGAVSTLLGIGGGSLTRPVMASFFKMPEKTVGQIARLSVFMTAAAGTISYLFLHTNNLEKSDGTTQIISIGVALAIGGVFGFPTGARMHAIVLEAKRDQDARKGFGILLGLLFLCIASKLIGQELLSQIMILGSGLFVCVYIMNLTKKSKKIIGCTNED